MEKSEKMQQSLLILDVCLSMSKPQAEKRMYHHYPNIIIFEKLHFQNVFHPY